MYYVEGTEVKRFNPFTCSSLWDKSQSGLMNKTANLTKELFYRAANPCIAASNYIYSFHNTKSVISFIPVDDKKLAALKPEERALVDKYLYDLPQDFFARFNK
jgi:hypothetical protein